MADTFPLGLWSWTICFVTCCFSSFFGCIRSVTWRIMWSDENLMCSDISVCSNLMSKLRRILFFHWKKSWLKKSTSSIDFKKKSMISKNWFTFSLQLKHSSEEYEIGFKLMLTFYFQSPIFFPKNYLVLSGRDNPNFIVVPVQRYCSKMRKHAKGRKAKKVQPLPLKITPEQLSNNLHGQYAYLSSKPSRKKVWIEFI